MILPARMTEPKTNINSYEAFSVFIRALNHALRTPLSVIFNDLNYLSSVSGAGSLPALNRCREMSTLLTRLQPPGLFQAESMSLAVLLEELRLPAPAPEQPAMIRVCLSALRYCLELIHLLLPQSEASALADWQARRLALIFKTGLSPAPGWESAAGFTSYFCSVCSLDSCLPPLIDAVLDSHGASTVLTANPAITIRVELPFV